MWLHSPTYSQNVTFSSTYMTKIIIITAPFPSVNAYINCTAPLITVRWMTVRHTWASSSHTQGFMFTSWSQQKLGPSSWATWPRVSFIDQGSTFSEDWKECGSSSSAKCGLFQAMKGVLGYDKLETPICAYTSVQGRYRGNNTPISKKKNWVKSFLDCSETT